MSLYLLTGQRFPCPSERAKAPGRPCPRRALAALARHRGLFWKAALTPAIELVVPFSQHQSGDTGVLVKQGSEARLPGFRSLPYTDELCVIPSKLLTHSILCLSVPTLSRLSQQYLSPGDPTIHMCAVLRTCANGSIAHSDPSLCKEKPCSACSRRSQR